MPTASLVVKDEGFSSSTIKTVRPTHFLTLESDGIALDWVAPARNANRKLPRLTDIGDSLDTIVAGLKVRPTVFDEGISEDIILFKQRPRPSVTFALIDAADSFDFAEALVSVSPTILDIGESFDLAQYGFQMPVILEPGPLQVRGTVNLIPNPSLENTDIALRGWSAEAGSTLARTQADSWVGPWAGVFTVPIGVGTPKYLRIESWKGLRITGPSSFVGSVAVKGVVQEAKVTVKTVYMDGSNDEQGPDLMEPTQTYWKRLSSGSIVPNENKVVDYFELHLNVVGEAGALDVYVDGAQLEPEYSGGATDYTDGDQGDAYSWMATPNWSPSIRATLDSDS